MSRERQPIYPAEELVALVRSLDRAEEQGLFSYDVIKQYPHLAEAYTKVCPVRCDLATAAHRAQRNVYGHDTQLTTLRKDVELMVNNCILFNGTDSVFAEAARQFGKFAAEQIDAYVSRKTGGRRFSTLRLKNTATAAAMGDGDDNAPADSDANKGGTVVVTPVPERTPRGKRSREEEENHNAEQRKAMPSLGRNGSADDSKRNVSQINGTDITRELLKLIESLNRREDKNAFAIDVVKAYPELKDAYEAICPVKMNLIIMQERAASGYYFNQQQQPGQRHEEVTSFLGGSVADSLTLLRSDVELMVNNCLRFNSGAPKWEQLAESFHLFAHKKIDDFVLRHAPHLKGTRSGVDAYARDSRWQAQERLPGGNTESEAEGAQQSAHNTLPVHSEAVPSTPTSVDRAAPLARKRDTSEEKATLRMQRHSAIYVANGVAPTIQPTVLQPVFTVPEALRRRVISDHLQRGTLHARLISSNDIPHVNGDVSGAKHCNEENSGGYENGIDEPPRVYGSALSCRAVLNAFVRSVRDFYEAQRQRQELESPFLYSMEEEQLYMDCVALVKQQLERLFLYVVLYEQEKAEMYEWIARKAAQQMTTGKNTFSSANHCWLDEAHLCYLVRFLLHLPQLLGLACAEADPEADGSEPELTITSVAKGVIERIARVTEEMLSFISRYEEKVEGKPETGAVGEKDQTNNSAA
ncbi:Bromodomain [Trypanosoma vivax]|uniref:Bromo domain-containing protein n=1 Tax=Trypanosoma vivax (strain Y486) TaxID=1055687 RepID=G0U8L7_TRYVY|nr:hypothetical protein TRVL_00471 [Trypanosoma vivax]KAH8604876.1 Bromodomain [Trypanosoma vivax]CCC53943.1 conserved hypothetical protein [Trypanosoma vivax Y486]